MAKKKLFSLIFDYTKNFTDEIISDRLIEISKDVEQMDEIQEYSKNYPRLVNNFKIIMFGINLFEEVFNIKLEKEDILNDMLKLRSYLSKELLDQFFEFCLKAKKFEEDYNEEKTNEAGSSYFVKHKGTNPKYLTCSLKLDKNGIYYIFTHDNLRDFNEYTKQNFSLKKLGELLEQTIEDKNLIKYTKSIRYGNNVIGAIKIRIEWLNK